MKKIKRNSGERMKMEKHPTTKQSAFHHLKDLAFNHVGIRRYSPVNHWMISQNHPTRKTPHLE